MKLVLCHSILKKELAAALRYFSKGDLKKAVLKAHKGLGKELKTALPDTKLIKVYLTGKAGAGRLIVLVFIKKDTYVPVILRHKNDKQIGVNMSNSNPAFQKLLDTYLDVILSDLRSGEFDAMDL